MEAAKTLVAGKSLACLLSSYLGAGVLYCCLSPARGSVPDTNGYADVVVRLRQLAEDREGNLIVERAPLRIKQQLDVWGEAGNAFPVMRAIKNQFDPDGILNPGRYVGRL
jgi:FAD/FMN-containing dehydrogenase